MSNRLVRRYFKCHKCKDIEAQLIHPNSFDIKCSKCGAFLNEIQEKEFKILKTKKKQTTEHKSNNDAPYMPSENAFRNISSVYNRPPSHKSNQRQNQNQNINNYTNNNNNNNRNRFLYNNNQNNNTGQQQRNRRYQSTNHYSDMNIVNDNNNNYNNYNNINNIRSENNININNINNNSSNQFRESQNRININQNENNENEERRRNYGNGARNRGRSQEPMGSFFSHLLGNMILGGLFGGPMGSGTPIIISSSGQGPFRIYVQRQNVPQYIFDPLFLSFGSMFNNEFRDNFSSNFRSNFRGDFLSEIIRILERNQEEAARRAHPPASESALKKLKRFPLTEKYCKKDKNGKIELPNCCICLSDIEKNEETVLLPCGHMYHWNCCLNWLKGNNTCPMCRFVIKD